jgi:cob(I)alamin adenosyltransferase
MVHLTKIYTKTGDGGETRLGDNSIVNKDSLLVKTMGLVDSANAQIGLVLAMGKIGDNGRAILNKIQNELFDLGADLCTPLINVNETGNIRITDKMVENLEFEIDTYNMVLEELRSFVMPGGTPTSALFHVARTKVREAEVSAWNTRKEERYINETAIRYLNRLSDLLFVMARFYNENEHLWVPGGADMVAEQHPPKRFRDIGNAE